MNTKATATITSKGQLTLPAEIRRRWDLRAGDQIAFEISGKSTGTFAPRRRRSIFDSREALALPSLGRPLTQTDIDEAVAVTVRKKFGGAAKRKAP